MSLKNPVTPPGIDPRTVRIVAQRLTHYATSDPIPVIKVQFTLEETRKTQTGSRGIGLPFFNLGARWDGWSTPRPDRFTPGKDPVPIV